MFIRTLCWFFASSLLLSTTLAQSVVSKPELKTPILPTLHTPPIVFSILPPIPQDARHQSLLRYLEHARGVDSTLVESIFADKRFVRYEFPKQHKSKTEQRQATEEMRALVLSSDSLAWGKALLSSHQTDLVRAEKLVDEKVDRATIVAVTAVETRYGTYLGEFKIPNAIYSWYLRARHKEQLQARAQFADYLRLVTNFGWNPFEFPSSSTGAFGLTQYEPTSYRNPRLTADCDGDGKVDLFSYPDAFCSTAKYFAVSGWENNDAESQCHAILRYNPSPFYADLVREYRAELLGIRYDEVACHFVIHQKHRLQKNTRTARH
jgi:membrane-bound lytic murein transglycosylase B